MKGAAIRIADPPADLKPASIRYRSCTKECRSSGRSLSPDGSSTSLCAASAYTSTHAHSRAHRTAVHCAVDAVTMQLPMQFRAIQVRLALCTSDTVTVYPSPTHTRTNVSRKHRRQAGRRTNASDDTHGRRRWGSAAVDAALMLYVPLLRERSRMWGRDGDLRLRPLRELLAWPTAKTTWPTTRVRATSKIGSVHRESRPSGDKTADNSAPEGYWRLWDFWQNLLMLVSEKKMVKKLISWLVMISWPEKS